MIKQSSVLQKLEELDGEADSLRREVADNLKSKDQLKNQLTQFQNECSSLQMLVAEQEVSGIIN